MKESPTDKLRAYIRIWMEDIQAYALNRFLHHWRWTRTIKEAKAQLADANVKLAKLGAKPVEEPWPSFHIECEGTGAVRISSQDRWDAFVESQMQKHETNRDQTVFIILSAYHMNNNPQVGKAEFGFGRPYLGQITLAQYTKALGLQLT